MLAHKHHVGSVLYFFWDWEKRAAGNKGARAGVLWENKVTGLCFNVISLALGHII